MTRDKVARGLAGAAVVGFLGTAALHGTGYGSVVRASTNVPGMIGRLMPALWLAFSFDLVVLALILTVLVLRPADVARPILAIAALCPFAVAALQVVFLGFIPPTALLIALGLLTWAAAATWPSGSRAE